MGIRPEFKAKWEINLPSSCFPDVNVVPEVKQGDLWCHEHVVTMTGLFMDAAITTSQWNKVH